MAIGSSPVLVSVSASLMGCDGDGKKRLAERKVSGFGCGCISSNLAVWLAG